MANLDRQLDALTKDLLALDEAEARQELEEVEARIAFDGERAARLRSILQLKEAWTRSVTIATPSGNQIVVHPVDQNGKKPKTRDAILAFFRADDLEDERVHYVAEIRRHLKTLGIDISGEAIRQALRRLITDGELTAGKTTDGRGYYRLTPKGAQTTLGADQK
jgi:hypothetical protein